MKKKNIIIVVIFIVMCGLIAFLFMNREKSMSDIYEAAGINYEKCVERATKVEITVPSECIGEYDERYVDKDKVVAVLTKQDELSEFFGAIEKTKGHKEPAPTEDYENPFFKNPYIYVIAVYDGEEILFKSNLVAKDFGPDATNIKEYYVLKDNLLSIYICDNLDKEPFEMKK